MPRARPRSPAASPRGPRRSAARRRAGDLGLEHEPRLQALPHVVETRARRRRSPRLTSNSTRPSPASRRNASRTEPREMPSWSASSPWARREPGASEPATIIERISSYARPTTDADASGRAECGPSRGSGMVDIRCSNVLSWRRPGRKWMMRPNDTGGCDRMSQADAGDASSGTLGKKNLDHDPRGRAGARDRAHVLGRPRARRRLAPGHRRRLERGAGSPARRARRGRDRVHDLALCPEVRRRGRCLRVPHARGAPVGRRPHVPASSSSVRSSSAAAASTSGSGSSPTTSGRPTSRTAARPGGCGA